MDRKAQETTTWGAKQKMEDCIKSMSWVLLGPSFPRQLQRHKGNVHLPGWQRGMLSNPDAVFTLDFGNRYHVVFLIVIMALRGIKCPYSFQWNIKFEV